MVEEMTRRRKGVGAALTWTVFGNQFQPMYPATYRLTGLTERCTCSQNRKSYVFHKVVS